MSAVVYFTVGLIGVMFALISITGVEHHDNE